MKFKFFKGCIMLILLVKCYCTVELECGKEYKPPKIYIGGGREVDDYEHPWFCDYDIVIADDTQSHCGGTLISHEYIVTAAHCFDNMNSINLHKKIINIRCGVKNNKTFLTATKVIMNPRWDANFHDIAVIEIPKVAYSTTLRPACVISREELLLDSKLTVVGTGSTYMSWITGMPKYAQTTDIYLRDFLTCKENYGSWVKSYENVLCAGDFWKTVQPGDSGGPLLVFYNKRYYLVGIISGSKSNFMGRIDQRKYPALFTRIKSECEFFKDHTNFACYSNLIPIRDSDEDKHVCGYTSSYLNGTTLHPWYCRIYNAKGNDFCGATLISSNYAVTAAHCVEPENRKFDSRTSYIECGLNQEKRRFKKIVISPKYNRHAFGNDISVLEFKEEFRFEKGTVPICLLAKDYTLGGKMTTVMMSHKYDKARNNGMIISEFPVLQVERCQFSLSGLSVIDDNTICTKDKNHKIHNNDIGSPLVTALTVNGETKYFIAGIVSKNRENSKVISFTKVQSFADFIFEVSKIRSPNTANHVQISFSMIFTISIVSIIFQKWV